MVGQKTCPKHAEFYSKNKFEKLVYLVGFIIRIYHDARSSECQILIPVTVPDPMSRALLGHPEPTVCTALQTLPSCLMLTVGEQHKIKTPILTQSPLFYCYHPTRQSNVYLVNSSRG